MSQKQRWVFDVEIEGEEPHYTIREIMTLADKCIQNKDYTGAAEYLKKEEYSSAARLRYANLLRTVPGICGLSDEERFRRAEKVLSSPMYESPAVCQELSHLYHQMGRPIAELAYFIQSHGDSPIDSDTIKKRLHKLELEMLERCPRDAYMLGIQLSGRPEMMLPAFHCLQTACEYGGKTAFAASAALKLAEMYEENMDLASAKHYNAIAAALGNPPLLRRGAEYRRN